MDMRKYFERKIGETLTKSYKTGETFFVEVYERVFKFEILDVTEDGELIAEVNSYDKVPSGYKLADSDTYFGELTINIKGKSKAEVLDSLAYEADQNFFKRYMKQLSKQLAI